MVDDLLMSEQIENVRNRQLVEPLYDMFSDMEYLLRAGWTPDSRRSVYSFSLVTCFILMRTPSFTIISALLEYNAVSFGLVNCFS